MTKQKTYDRIARLYDLLDLPFEYRRYAPIRHELFAGVSGRVLDAGVGTGRNMAHYPAGAAITGIDLSANMLARARTRAKAGRTRARWDRLGIDVDLREMDVMATAFADGTFDYVIATFLFCVLDDDHQLPALRELKRICKPAGEIRIIEYAYSKKPLKKFIMKLWAPWVRWMYGATFDRDTERYLDAAGLDLIEERFLCGDIIKLLVVKPRA